MQRFEQRLFGSSRIEGESRESRENGILDSVKAIGRDVYIEDRAGLVYGLGLSGHLEERAFSILYTPREIKMLTISKRLESLDALKEVERDTKGKLDVETRRDLLAKSEDRFDSEDRLEFKVIHDLRMEALKKQQAGGSDSDGKLREKLIALQNRSPYNLENYTREEMFEVNRRKHEEDEQWELLGRMWKKQIKGTMRSMDRELGELQMQEKPRREGWQQETWGKDRVKWREWLSKEYQLEYRLAQESQEQGQWGQRQREQDHQWQRQQELQSYIMNRRGIASVRPIGWLGDESSRVSEIGSEVVGSGWRGRRGRRGSTGEGFYNNLGPDEITMWAQGHRAQAPKPWER